jgi:transposase
MYMSLIHTAELVGANPFDYLTQLQKHAKEVKNNPSQWMPWNYRDSVASAESGKTPPV